MKRLLVLVACLAPIASAHAYCVHNDLASGEVRLSSQLGGRGTLQMTLRPGEKFCCAPKDTECNPEGKITSNLDLEVAVLGKPEYRCGVEDRSGAILKITGGGTARVVPNPKAKSQLPYVVRVRSQDGRDVSGPSGVACHEFKPKGN